MTKQTEAFTLQINLIHGKPIRVTAELTDLQRRNLAQALERALQSGYLGVEVDGSLTVVPIGNVASLEVTPPPGGVMRSVARNVRRA